MVFLAFYFLTDINIDFLLLPNNIQSSKRSRLIILTLKMRPFIQISMPLEILCSQITFPNEPIH